MNAITDESHVDYKFTLALKEELTKEFNFIVYLCILSIFAVIVVGLVILLCILKLRRTNKVTNDNLLKYNENVEKIMNTHYTQLV